MPQFRELTSRVVPLLVDNIDTDQIIPARFLKVTDTSGLGENLFADWRAGAPTPGGFFLDNPTFRGAQILLAGDNFGCGSSREHAPWALLGAGFRAIISTSFADIFRNNSLKNGLLPVQIGRHDYTEFVTLIEKAPDSAVTIDLSSQSVTMPGLHPIPFPIDAFSKRCLLEGVDELGYLLTFEKNILAFEHLTGRAS